MTPVEIGDLVMDIGEHVEGQRRIYIVQDIFVFNRTLHLKLGDPLTLKTVWAYVAEKWVRKIE